jgi:Rrf2 family transcriptional regulator, nitric oxide-sensitive transcriptional repressor
MRLTQHTDFALRLLIYLGLAKPEHRPTIREAALAFGVAENHMVKVAHRMGQLGFITTTRGRGGGMELARHPSAIGVGDVVRATENDLAIVACMPGGGGGCPIADICVLQTALGEALQAFLKVLDSYSVQDLLKPAPALRLKLGK